MPQLVQTLKSDSSVAPGLRRGRLVGGVPALHDALELGRQFVLPIAGEPGPFDDPAAERRRRLLVLPREIIFADGAADLRQHRRPGRSAHAPRNSRPHAYPADTAIEIILDNHSAHVSRETTAWLAVQPPGRFTLHLHPDPWLNLI
jgi:hypothetical protein